MRMDTRQSFDAADLVNEWPESRIAQVLRRFGEERYAGGIAREIVRRRPLSTTSDSSPRSRRGCRPRPRSEAATRPSAASRRSRRRQRRLEALNEALPLAWDSLGSAPLRRDLLPSLGGPAGQQFLAEKARGCVCPPELPVCVCAMSRGRAPDPPAPSRRARPRSPRTHAPRSAHLRAASRSPATTPVGGERLMAVAVPAAARAPRQRTAALATSPPRRNPVRLLPASRPPCQARLCASPPAAN